MGKHSPQRTHWSNPAADGTSGAVKPTGVASIIERCVLRESTVSLRNIGIGEKSSLELGIPAGIVEVPDMSSGPEDPSVDLVHVSVASPAGAYTVGNLAFFRYIVRLAEMDLPVSTADQEALDILAAIPHAFDLEAGEEGLNFGHGWRVVPARGELDWPTLEATPRRLRSAFERARRILWEHAARFRVSARDIVQIEEELDKVYGVLMRAEASGFAVNISYTA